MGSDVCNYKKGIWAFLSVAAKEAKKSGVKFKHGAVVVVRGQIIARGYNKHCMSCQSGPVSIHAEIDAVSNCPPRILPFASLYVVRINKNGKLCESAPCTHCKSYLERIGIKTVFHS